MALKQHHQQFGIEMREKLFNYSQQAQERAGVHPANGNKDMAKTSRSSSIRSAEVTLEAADAAQQMPEPVNLTVKQLLVRRGLSLLLMLSVFAAAVSIAELLAA